ncbi:sensor histidine kinase [Paenibacillus sp. TRM 82003]|nr:sensor histidine kinase [Paenibacillus sp. TRM 82003]
MRWRIPRPDGFRTNTFAKISTLLVLLLIPILILYSLSNRVSVSVLKEEIQALKQKDLAYLANELNASIDNLSTMAFLLSEDIHIQQLQNIHLLESSYERYAEKSRLLERLRLLNVAERWDTQYSVIAPQRKEIVSTNPWVSFDIDALKEAVTPSWTFKEMKVGNARETRFVRHIVKPASKIGDVANAGLVVEVSFPKEYLVKELDNFKLGGKGDPFLYKPGDILIANRSADADRIAELTAMMGDKPIPSFDETTVDIGRDRYLVNAMEIDALDAYLVDYVPIDEILQPIVRSSNLFYGSVGLLLIMAVLAGYLLYRNVQLPIVLLIRGVQRLRSGDYSARIHSNPNNEFTFLFQRFNEMASEIDKLIHKVYAEEIRTREAKLKQLQSQINPHFLYNCFALIRSLARLGKKESVMDLAMHLSKYYRYTTRVEKTTATLREELQLIESYLEIQKLHMQHLSYRIEIPEAMWRLEVPRLLLQPIVENAVIHGIERSSVDGLVTIGGSQDERMNTIVVEDNGIGMSPEQLEKLRRAVLVPPTEESGCALWNIHQRLTLQFGDRATLDFNLRDEGGVTVSIRWPRE